MCIKSLGCSDLSILVIFFSHQYDKISKEATKHRKDLLWSIVQEEKAHYDEVSMPFREGMSYGWAVGDGLINLGSNH